jgi:predicted polyphosphate/ATP-dependent NAD kinase
VTKEIHFRLGVLVNPYAGIGGSVGLKGSDGDAIRDKALAMGAELRAIDRMRRALSKLISFSNQIEFFCFAGDMGEASVKAAGFDPMVVGNAKHNPSTAEDTVAAIEQLLESKIDLLLFAGGDGTARILVDRLPKNQTVLGVPAGVKIHSGVYAVSPEAAGDLLNQLISGKLVNLAHRDVKDIDEEAFRDGKVKAKYYGELWVPEIQDLLQQVKNAGMEKDELAQLDVVQTLIEELESDALYLVGTGSTTHLFLQELGLDGSLLGVDILLNRQLIAKDVSANQILDCIAQHQGPVKIIVTAIGGQGHILGRGNQQFTPQVIRLVGKDNIVIIAARGKILSLNGRPLLVDTHDPELDQTLSGIYRVIVGYQEFVLYQVGMAEITSA